MNIGQAAQSSGISAKMIRHYESIGLLPEARRSASGYRVYDDSDLHTLRFIKRSRKLGFPLERIRELLSLWQDRGRASADVKSIALEHARELERQIAELGAMRDTLRRLAADCAGDSRPDCPIIHELADSEG